MWELRLTYVTRIKGDCDTLFSAADCPEESRQEYQRNEWFWNSRPSQAPDIALTRRADTNEEALPVDVHTHVGIEV
jgi:hypothetical protein